MNFRTTLILLVLVGVGLALWLVTGKGPSETEGSAAGKPETTAPRYVLDPRPANNTIVRVEFERRDQPRLVFERKEKEGEADKLEPWRMTEPLVSETQTYMVDSLVSLLTDLQYNRAFKPGTAGAVAPADAGLEPPAARLTLTDKAGKTYALEIGRPAALSNDWYVRAVGRDDVLVVGRSMQTELDRKVNDYRSRTLVQLAAKDARQVQIRHAGTTYDLTRGAEEEWVINAPVKAYAQTDKVRTLVNSLTGLRVKDFIEDAPQSLAAYGLEDPFLTITVTTEEEKLVVKEGQQAAEQRAEEEEQEAATQPVEPRFEKITRSYTLLVGDFADLKNESRYVKLPDQPWVASANQAQIEKLVPRLGELRDTRLTRIKADDVTRVELTAGGASAAVEKQDGRWVGSGDLAELDADAVNKLVEALEDARATDYVDQPQAPATYGLDQPRATLVVSTRGAVAPLTLHIGNDTPSGRNTYVQLAGQSYVTVISAERAAELAVSPLALRSRAITSGTPEQITRIEVQRATRRYLLEREGDSSWRMLEPAGAPVDQAAIRELSNDLARLRARRVVAKNDDASYGLTQPELTVRFVMRQPAAQQAAAPAPPAPPAEVRPAESDANAPATGAAPPESDADAPATGAAPPGVSQTVPDTAPAEAAAPPAAPPAAAPVQEVAHTLLVGRKEDKTFARIDDVPYVFELDETVYKVMTQELIRRGLFDIRADDVRYLKIEAPGGTLEFERQQDKWRYPPDPFVQLSQKKVGEFVKELAELRADAYLVYREGDLAQFGLDAAPVTVTLRLADESTITLKVDQVRRGELPRKAAWVEQRCIFLLQPAESEKLLRGLEAYVQDETEDKEQKPAGPRSP